MSPAKPDLPKRNFTENGKTGKRCADTFCDSYGRKKYRRTLPLAGLFPQRPFTRLVDWGKKSQQAIEKYIEKNHAEAFGFKPFEPRNHRVVNFLEWWNQNSAFSTA